MKLVPRDVVRARIEQLGPSANIGHRGTGPTRRGHRFSENSISSFVAAIEEGADGIELDAGITRDGKPIVMHDDTVDRTTDCRGCVSQMTFDEIRACRLLDGNGDPTEEHPPTLDEVYGATGTALINVELKVLEEPRSTSTTGPKTLALTVVDAVRALGGASRTIFSSFDESVVERIRAEQPSLYVALLSREPDAAFVERAVALGVDAIHPFASVTEDVLRGALDAGLHVAVWIANTRKAMQQQIDRGATAIITDVPAVLARLLDETRESTR